MSKPSRAKLGVAVAIGGRGSGVPLVRRRRAAEAADDRAGGQAHGGGRNGGQNGIFDGLGGQGKIEHGKRTDGSKHAQ